MTRKVILELSDEAIKKATKLFDWEFGSDEKCQYGDLPASKEWSEFLIAWTNRELKETTKLATKREPT